MVDFSKLRAASTKAAAPKSIPEKAVTERTVKADAAKVRDAAPLSVTEVSDVKAVARELERPRKFPAASAPTPGLIAFNMASMTDALVAVVEQSEAGSKHENLFPVVEVTGGETGGSFKAQRGTPTEVADVLPEGTKPIPLVLIGYRTEALAWPEGKRDDEGDGPKQQPAWKCVIPGNAPDDYRLYVRAFERFTFKKKDDKAAYDIAAGGPGHLRAAFEALVYSPQAEGLIVLRGVSLYKSWVGSCQELSRLVGEDGQFIKDPLAAFVRTTTEKGSKAWPLHTLCFTLTPEAGRAFNRDEIRAAWNKFAAAHAEDREMLDKMNRWLTGDGHAMTDSIREKLKESLTL